MRSARDVYRVNLALSGIAALVVLAGAGIALARIELSPGPIGQLLSDCGRFLLPHVTPLSLIALGLGALGTVVLARGLRSGIRQVRGCRRFLCTLELVGERQIANTLVTVISGPRVQAFCAGFIRPRVYLSGAAADRLSGAQLKAVVAHEAHHARRRDPLRIASVTVLADALFFLPSLQRLKKRYAELAELAADEAAIAVVGRPAHLAAALLEFGEDAAPGVVGIDPERVDHLLGSPTRWRVPVWEIGVALVTIAGLLALVVTTAASPAVGRVSLTQLAAQSCMIAMTAAPVIVLAALAMVGRRSIVRLR